MIEWISVKDRLPDDKKEWVESDTFYLVFNGEPEIAFYWGKNAWDSPCCGEVKMVTHWAEINLPEDKP
jgi:hypothetical protein